jgi:hypothetical protein
LGDPQAFDLDEAVRAVTGSRLFQEVKQKVEKIAGKVA